VLQAVKPPKNFLLISIRLNLRNQVTTRGCRQSGGNNGRETVKESHFKASFVNYGLVDNLNYHTGTAEFRGKEIKYDRKNHRWTYFNNRPVNFHTPSEHNTLAEEEDTVQVEELLETTE
jgi:hypothetical protein